MNLSFTYVKLHPRMAPASIRSCQMMLALWASFLPVVVLLPLSGGGINICEWQLVNSSNNGPLTRANKPEAGCAKRASFDQIGKSIGVPDVRHGGSFVHVYENTVVFVAFVTRKKSMK